jgi:pyruvate dehydrogenase E2 component (dihydrolipoamide acetyltransferase)
MPQLGLEVSEGTVTAVLVEIGGEVRANQPLMELETDKAVTEVLAPCDGIVRTIEAGTGDTVLVGAVLITLADAQGEVRLRVAPVARRAAADLGIDLATVDGTGPRGRITLGDVRGAAANGRSAHGATPPEQRVATAPAQPVATPPEQPAATPPEQPAATPPAPAVRVELTATRRAIARRMTASQSIPQYHLIRDVDATHILAEKAAQATRSEARVGINDLLVQALAETAVRHPALVTAYVEGDPAYLVTRENVDVGLAVSTERGLVVPVIRTAQTRGLAAIAAERDRLVMLARSGRIGLGEMSGAAITISSLAGAGIDRFTAMVNPGESTIVAIGRTVERLVPRGRTIAIVPTLALTLSFDHRVVDGAVGAAALAELAELLEGGMTWRP